VLGLVGCQIVEHEVAGRGAAHALLEEDEVVLFLLGFLDLLRWVVLEETLGGLGLKEVVPRDFNFFGLSEI